MIKLIGYFHEPIKPGNDAFKEALIMSMPISAAEHRHLKEIRKDSRDEEMSAWQNFEHLFQSVKI
jgi:hypothetical protein